MLFALPALVSAEPAVWDSYAKRLELLRYVEYWQEPAGAVPLDSVRQLPEREWQSNGKDSVSLGYGDKVYWFRVNVRNPGAATAPLFLEIGYPVLDHIEVYLLEDGELVKRQLLGDKQPFYQRPIYHRNFLVPLSLSRDDELSIYLRVDTTSSMQVPLTLWDQDAFYVAEQARSLFEGIYYVHCAGDDPLQLVCVYGGWRAELPALCGVHFGHAPVPGEPAWRCFPVSLAGGYLVE